MGPGAAQDVAPLCTSRSPQLQTRNLNATQAQKEKHEGARAWGVGVHDEARERAEEEK